MQINSQYDEIDELLSIIDSAIKALIQKNNQKKVKNNNSYLELNSTINSLFGKRKYLNTLNDYDQSFKKLKNKLSGLKQRYLMNNSKRSEITKKINHIHRLKKYIEQKSNKDYKKKFLKKLEESLQS